ncbi:MAG: uroporphyrinogen-III C-methyltransferase [Porticoccaceae bacterium]|nr:uroporphyrinogen-III C-methyltransferase [Porticoccaceae bacterium]MDG1705052.1 uroporphyrinogen-III C-methyltransferase [Porticoccaceae bacterium]
MTEDSKPATDKTPEKQPELSKQPEPNKQPNALAASIFHVLKIILILGLIAAVLAGSWLGWSQWQLWTLETDRSEIQLTSLRDSMDSIEQQYRLDQERQAIQSKQFQQALTDLQLRSNSQGRRLAELGSTTRSDWLLAEAVYLTRLAAQRLQTERRTKNSLALLSNADQILQELDDPDLTPARSAMAADITALRLAGEVDVEGIYLELNSLVDSIDQLSILSAPAQSEAEQQSAAESIEESPTPESVLEGFSQQLAQLIRVRQRSQPIEPMLQPEEATLVRQNIRLMLEQAQSALLREQQVIFSRSIGKAQSWLVQYFQLNPSAQVLSDRLSELAKAQVVQQLPEINTSLEAIETAIVLRQSRLMDKTELENQE